MSAFTEVPDSRTPFRDTEFIRHNQELADQWVSISELYPNGVNQPLLPEKMSREQFEQGNHFECFMLSALSTLVRFPEVIRNCFVTKKVRQDGRYTFQFFRGQSWEKVEIDDTIALEDDDVLYMQSPTEHWWPLLLEKAYAKFYASYEHLEGCTLLETFHDLTGHPVQNIPMTLKLAKSAGVDIEDGQYWLSMGESLQRGDYVASALTKASELEAMGMQSEQQYAILEILSLTGSSTLDAIVVHLHNPFEDDEFAYTGPLNAQDPTWTAKQRKQYPVDDRHSIFMPLNLFIKVTNSIQFCFMHTLEDEVQYFNAEWKGRTAGGNPTYSTWRKNPTFLVRNEGTTAVKVVVMIQQEDQRRTADAETGTAYHQCGLVVVRPSYPNPLPSFWITGNNHKTVFKSLFLNSREVANVVTIPPNSMCFMLPSTLKPSLEAPFRIAVYRFKKENYSRFSIEPMSIPGIDWANPATQEVVLSEKEKDRVDFYVDEATDVHILLQQTKPYASKSGGDAMTTDFIGMYLYDDTDRRIGGVHAATNFREISVIQRVPRSGRYAVSLTCPRGKGEVPALVAVVTAAAANARMIDPPEDAGLFDDEDLIDEGGDDDAEAANPIDFAPIHLPPSEVAAAAESDTPFEERRFYMDNRDVTSEPWVHIGDLYPEGKTKPLLPDDMNHSQFQQGEHYDCHVLTALASLLDHHPDVIRNCFVTKKPRKDGRYTFQFHRYGQWIKVEIDDRIPLIKGDTVFCRSPTHHWWPLLLEKAYAKFYTLYDNLEGISQGEIFHDFTGQPCLTISTDPADAKVNMSYFDEAQYWLNLREALPGSCIAAQARGTGAEAIGLLDEQYYAVLDIIPVGSGSLAVSDILVKMYNPYEDAAYTGPMNADDSAWTPALISQLQPQNDAHVFFIPASDFPKVFTSIDLGYLKNLAEPSWHFNSDWASDTNGGNTSLISWRENPLYVFRNTGAEPVQVVAMARQPDQRHLLHTLDSRELNYPHKGLAVALANPNAQDIPTHLVTLDNHRLIHSLPLVAQREVTNVLTIPPHSLCYVVGHLNGLEESKFMLSYWFTHAKDAARLQVARYKPTVAKHAPALAHVALHAREKERVDFIVDVPTDVHAVLRQEKPFASPVGGDVIAEDYLGVYLYDLQSRRIKGSLSATNYREVSVVAHVSEPGHYVLVCTCPRGNGTVPCKVEICAVEEAHVRIADAPEGVRSLEEPDLAFLDRCPEGIPVAELPFAEDTQFQKSLSTLRGLLDDPNSSEQEIQRLQQRLNARAHELAKASVGTDRPTYLPQHDLDTLSPYLDDNAAYMAAEQERYELKKDPRNDYKIAACEERLRAMADVVAAEAGAQANLDFIDARPEGIPREDIPLQGDSAFSEMAKQRTQLLRHADDDPQAVADIEAAMNARAREMARAMHDAERGHLDREPEGLPLALLPLNEDRRFGELEDRLRAEQRGDPVHAAAVRDLQAQLNDRAHELAKELRATERAKFLCDANAEVDGAALDKDASFAAKEVERLQLLHEDPHGNAAAIHQLEESLNVRAAEVAEALKADERGFLAACGVDADVLCRALDGNAKFQSMEAELRELRKDPRANAAAIKALEAEMQRLAQQIEEEYLAGERQKLLAPEYEGRPLATLPLSDDRAYCEAEAAYLKARESGDATPAELQRLLDAMDKRAAAVARELNEQDRAAYLPESVRGLPVKTLRLDSDEEFCRLEQERARAASDPSRAADVAALEEQLRARADALAQALLSNDRAYLHPTPAGVPLSLVPLDGDAGFCAKEAERARLKSSPSPSATALANVEADLNQRAVEVAQALKEAERAVVLADSYEGIPTSELPLDSDRAFAEAEIARLRLVKEEPVAHAEEVRRLESVMGERARELAAAKKADERGFLAGADSEVPTRQLQRLLDGDERFAELERQLRELRKDPRANAAAIKALEAEMQRLAQQIQEEYLAGERQKLLAPEYEGRPLATLPLSDDRAYCEAEAAYLKARESGDATPAELQRLLDAMDKRAAAVARELNEQDRAAYLPESVRGLPVKTLRLDSDEEFCRLEQERARAASDPSRAADVAALEEQLRARADALAQALLSNDRAYLHPTPAGVPLSLVPLDGDAGFCAKEAERARLKSSPSPSATALANVEADLNQRAVEVAQALKEAERAVVLADSYEGIPTSELPLDSDRAFAEAEIARLRLVKEEPVAHAEEVRRLESVMGERARELAAAKKADERGFLAGADSEVPTRQLQRLLDGDERFAELERQLRELRKDPRANAAAIKALEAEMQRLAQQIQEEYLAGERQKLLAPEYEGRPLATLPLSDDRAYCEAEAAYLKARESGDATPAELQRLLDAMDKRAAAVARELNERDRAAYMPESVRGLPLRTLRLDSDEEFCRLEQERARAASDPSRAADVAALEEQLRARADALAQEWLSNDRAFLDKLPEGVPLSCLRIDEHENFRAKEEQRAALRAGGSSVANHGAVVALEESMNQQVHEMAKKLKAAEIAECVPATLRGIPREVLPLMDDDAATEIMVTRATSQSATDSARHAGALKARAKAMAAAAIDSVRSRLQPAPLQLPLAELSLDKDETFKSLEVEAIREMQKPQPSEAALQELIADLDKRAYALAEQQCWAERETFMEPAQQGRPLRSLPLNTDEAFLAAEAAHRAAAKEAGTNPEHLHQLEDRMTARARELAAEANCKDRASYLPVTVRGVAHQALPLDDDDDFCALECTRAAALQDPMQKAAVQSAEDALRSRALAIAEGYLKNDRAFLDARPEGVPLRQVPVDGDRVFAQLEEQRAHHRSAANAEASSAEVAALEAKMNERARELARAQKERLRGKLHQMVQGLALHELPLDADAAFNNLEERLRDAEAQQDDAAAQELKEALNDRAVELADGVHDAERAPLQQTPAGVPLSSLPLNTDAEFLALEAMARSVAGSAAASRQSPRKSDVAKLAALQDHLNQRATELAYAARREYCDAQPEGIALEDLSLAKESAFLRKEAERRALVESHGPDSDAVAACDRELNGMAHEIARDRLEGDRDYLDREPEGVALAVLPLSSDPKFHELEVERAKLKAHGSAAAAPKIKVLEDKLNERAHELAKGQKANDLDGLEAAPFGIPLAVLEPHKDAQFAAMVERLRELRKLPGSEAAVAALLAEMNERCRALAKARVEDDRGYLDQHPEGVPITLLPLDSDAAFKELEARRANLKSVDQHRNGAAVKELEDKLNDRAHELAKARIAQELEGVDPTPFGVPLELLHPYHDPECKELVSALRELPTLDRSDPQVARLKAAMDERCQAMAHDLLERDRSYLHKNPKEVPLSLLPLNSDDAFHAAEVRRAVLKGENPRRNAEKIAELENQLNLRALELAEQRRAADLEQLDSAPEGVPLAVLNPHSDAVFAELVEQRRALELGSGAVGQAQLPVVIAAMNERAHELARDMLDGDREYLDPYPEGVPLQELPIDTDKAFCEMEVERAALKTASATRNANKIKDLEERLNNRAHELARQLKEDDLAVVRAAPRGIPLELLRPHEDPQFAEQVQTLRDFKRNPPRDASEVEQLVASMNERADELAAEVMDREYLDPAPNNVALAVLPLDADDKFRAMEVERATLKLTDPRRQADKIAALEAGLNQRALELAQRQRETDLDAVDSAPCDLPKELLSLHDDARARAIIDELRVLRESPTRNAEAIAEAKAALNARAHEVAAAMLTGERVSYLEPRPSGIPLEDLPLDTDPAFHTMEVERARLKAINPVRNAAAIRTTEGLLNDRACELAEGVKDDDLAVFPPSYEGILVKDLRPHRDRVFGEAAEKRRSRKRNPSVSFKEDLEQIMGDRLAELAREMKHGDLYFLEADPHGVPLADLPLSTDAAFTAMLKERHALRETDPMSNRKAINQLERDMNQRVAEMAQEMLRSDFDGIELEPLGIPIELLEPRRDPVIAHAVPELRRAKRLPQLQSKVAELQGKVNERVLELAGAALEQGREDYLDPEPEGVPLALLPLRSDEQFHGNEAKRATFRLEDAVKHAVAIEQLEAQLNRRVHQLAEEQLRSDLDGIDPAPRDIPLELLKPHDDSKLVALIKDMRVLKKDPVRNADKIAAQQRLMNARACELATEALDGDRGYLEPNPHGVPIAVLPLDLDPPFHDSEVARAVEKRAEEPNARAIAELEAKLNARLQELAAAQLKRDLDGLEQAPLGVPMSLLQPHDDSVFAGLLPELRRLAKDPTAHAARLKHLRAAANERDYELAEEFVARDRRTYLEAEPEGLALALLPLSADREFKELEAKKLSLQGAAAEGHPAKAEEVARLEEQLRERARQVARQQLRQDRGYLDPYPQGVPLTILPLDTDPKFREMEAKRAAHKARNAHTQASELEDALNARVHELAVAQKAEDLRGLDEEPCGIPLTALEPHQDAQFAQLVDELRRVKASEGEGARGGVAAVQEQMKERTREMAEAVTKNDRRYLHQRPEDVPLPRLPLDADPAFHAMEVERAKLKLADAKKNQHRIADLEEQLNDRARELAKAVKAQDLAELVAAPRGVPIELLDLHNDPRFSALLEQRAQASASGDTAPVVQALNACAEEAADRLLRGDRGYLDREPEGVPLSQLPLDADAAFAELEVQRAVLKARDPRRNATSISDLEDQLNSRAHEMAAAALAADRDYLDPQPEGVPLAELPLATDSKFHAMEVERARLKARDPVGNAARIAELEGRLNGRAADLAKKQLEEDLQGLDREPEGYPLRYLKPHHDEAFAAAVTALRAAKRRTPADAAKVREVQAVLNARAHAMAKERITTDRAQMTAEPEGVPLTLLSLQADARFAQAEKEFRAQEAAEKRNPSAMKEALGRMNDRAAALAKEYLQESRGFLDQEPERVPLEDVPLDEDAEFRGLEKERFRLLAEGASPSSPQVRAVEEKLNDRVHELATAEKARARGFLRASSSDLPRELLALDSDRAFVAKEKELRAALRDSAAASPERVSQLRAELQARADEIGEAQLKGGRDKYLDVQSTGVDLCDIPVDDDKEYHEMEVQRAVLLAADPRENSAAAAALEAKLNERAHELARRVVVEDRDFLSQEVSGIALEELPLDTDNRFKKLERQRRAHKRSPSMKKEVLADEEELRARAIELANEVIAHDLDGLKDFYRGIPKEELNLHADAKFHELAKKRRRCRGKGRVEATQMASLDEEMDRRACEIADDVIENERAFLDAEPEGMLLVDIPLDSDPTFQRLEREYRRRSKDPRTTKQNKEVLRELGEEMNRRAHTLAREEFARRREFMKQEPEGIPLWELGLDEDPEFKKAEIARYRNERGAAPSESVRAETAQRMEQRAGELSRAVLAADRAFLDPEPDGVALELLPLDTDKTFGNLARERRRHKKALKSGTGEAEVRAVEERMNTRTQEMARDFLDLERAFLPRDPEGVPLEDLPLNTDAPFRALEKERLQLKRDPVANAALIAAKESELEERAEVIARDLLRKERAFLEPEPMGVPLEELPLNNDPILNQVERKRRTLRANPKQNHEGIRACEEQMADRIGEIVSTFVDKQRSFLDQEPEGVPLRYLPLSSDRDFHEKELLHRRLLQRPEKNRTEIAEVEKKMNDRVHALARDLVLKGRAFLLPEPLGVPIADVPLNGDEEFRKLEEQRRALKEAGRSPAHIKAIEDKLNERAEMLAQKLLDAERAFMAPTPLGIQLRDIPLNGDARMRAIERTRRQLRKEDPERHAADIAVLEAGMEGRAYELADELLASERAYLHPEPCGVPLRDLPLHADADFHEMELQHFREKRKGRTDLQPLEKRLNARLMELAQEFITKDREYLDQQPEGISLDRLPLDADPVFHALELERRQLRRGNENSKSVQDIEQRLNSRVHELALEIRGWQDSEFQAANQHVAEHWPRVCELYPEGRYEAFVPAAPSPGDVASAPEDAGYLVPFLSALTRHPVLLQRLIVTKEPPVNAPYSFVFFDPDSNPVTVDIDDRVPCDANGEPRFTRSPYQAWWPLLLEKAYAKFVGGYEQLDNCTPVETLRDLTGRPVTHTPFNAKLAEAANAGDCTTVEFWRGVVEDLGRGNVIVCTSSESAPDGVHPLCSYALLDVIITLSNTTNPSDVVVKLENSYRGDSPQYTGPLRHNDINWNVELQNVCRYEPDRDDVLYMPLPTFLRNFSSMQTCHINCGDRLTAGGAWDSRTAGGSPKYTTFRKNPVYLLQNMSSRPATVLVELRHDAPLFVDPDGLHHYPQSGVVLMEPTSTASPPTPLVTNSTARFLQKGVMLDSREVCSLMELPPSTTCWLIPHTSKTGQFGAFHLSVYPGFAKVTLTPMHFCGLSREPASASLTLSPGEEGRRVDFTISAACEVHVLLRQEKVTDSHAAQKGDAIAEDDVVMVAFNDQAMKITSSGDATNAREHSLAFKADKPGYYSLLVTSPNPPVTGSCPCTVSIFTPKRTTVKFVAPPVGARPLQQSRFPTLPKNAKTNGNAGRRSRAPSSSRTPQRGESLPPLRNGSRTPGHRDAVNRSMPASLHK